MNEELASELAVERRQVTGHRTAGHGKPAAFSDLDRLRRSG